MKTIRIILLMTLAITTSLVKAQVNNNFVDEDNQYWTSVPYDYVVKGRPSCQSLIDAKNTAMLLTFIQYKQDSLKGILVVPNKSPARINSSTPGMKDILAMDHKTYVNKYVSVLEKGNELTIAYRNGTTKLVDSYVYEPTKNIRYYVALQPADASLQLAIDEAKKKGLPGSKEVKCTGAI